MDIARCVRCGSTYKPDHSDSWGSTAESDGYGPQPCCTALVPSPRAPVAQDGKRYTGEMAKQVCRGQLIAESVDVGDSRALRAAGTTPIAPR